MLQENSPPSKYNIWYIERILDVIDLKYKQNQEKNSKTGLYRE